MPLREAVRLAEREEAPLINQFLSISVHER